MPWKLWRAVLLIACLCPTGRAADPAFVGLIALTVEDDVAKELGLSDDQRKQLSDLVSARENDALELALSIKDLEPEEQKAKLAPFVAESEKKGLAILTKEQQQRLAQLRIAREGLATLNEPAVAEAIGLNNSQRSNIGKMLASLKTKLDTGTDAERRAAKAEVERELAKLLNTEQRSKWDQLAGISGGGEPEKVASADTTEKPDPEKPSTKTDDEPSDRTEPDNSRSTSREPDANAEDDEQLEVSKPQPPKNLEDVRLRFQFSYTPWKTVLEWFAKEADLSLVSDVIPDGTCNYRDARSYTVAQALDLMNAMLQTRGYVLIRRERMLLVHDLENGPPPQHWAEMVRPEDLEKRGDYELLSCVFRINKLSPEDVEADVKKLIGPSGSLSVLPKTKQLYVTETAAKLRAIQSIIQDAEDPKGKAGDKVVSIVLKHKLFEEIMTVARPLMGIPEGLMASPDGSLRVAYEGGRIHLRGTAERIEEFQSLVETIDIEAELDPDAKADEQPQVEVYAISTADPASVLKVLQTILAGQPLVRLEIDPKTGSLLAHATPTQHATIKAVIDQMQKDTRQFKVFKLRKIDPETAVVTLSKALGIVEGQQGGSAPKIVADAELGQLMVFGSKAQIDQIGKALEEMGELPPDSAAAKAERSTTRLIPLTGKSADLALENLQDQLLGLGMPNKIRISTPSSGSGDSPFRRIPVPKDFEKRMSKPPARPTPAGESSKEKSDDKDSEESRDRDDRSEDRGRGDRDRSDKDDGDRKNQDDRRSELEDRRRLLERSTGIRQTVLHRAVAAKARFVRELHATDENEELSAAPEIPAYFVALQDAEEKPAEESTEPANPFNKIEPAAADDEKATEENAETKPAAIEEKKSVPGADIVITVTPRGIMVTSQDLDALDDVEAFLEQYMEETGSSSKEYEVFYLKYARADAATELLQQALGGGGGDDGGGGSLMGDIAGQMLGGGMGGIMGGLLGGGGGGSSSVSSGPVLLIPDNRLNAILAQGRPADLDLARQLLEVIDQPQGPEKVETMAKPRFIAVQYMPADEMAAIIRQVFASRMQAEAGQQRQPTPQELMQALRGGGRGRGGAGGDRKSEEQKMTIGVDTRSNSLIVSAPEYLFEEVKAMVENLDIAGSTKDEVVQSFSLAGINPVLLEQSLQAILGENVTVNRPTGETTTTSSRPGSNNQQRSNNASRNQRANQPNQQQNQQQPNAQNFQQNADIMRMLQSRGGFGGRGGGGGGGGRGGGNRRGQ